MSVYVDGFKMVGKKENLADMWTALREDLDVPVFSRDFVMKPTRFTLIFRFFRESVFAQPPGSSECTSPEVKCDSSQR